MYLFREDFWDQELGETFKLENLRAEMPLDINLDHIYCTYRKVEKLNDEKEKENLG